MDWDGIHTLLLDMDGTLLDLHFDSLLWKTHLPKRYAERHGMDVNAAERYLTPRIRAREGTLEWYCLDHWTHEFDIDISALEHELSDHISVRPHAGCFLAHVRDSGRRMVLTTNAHRRSLELKLSKSGIGTYFDLIVSAHDFGTPKEDPSFWGKVHALEPFDPATTLLIDDNSRVLASARAFGIRHLLGIRQPDSQAPRHDSGDFSLLESFLDLMPIHARKPAHGSHAPAVGHAARSG